VRHLCCINYAVAFYDLVFEKVHDGGADMTNGQFFHPVLMKLRILVDVY